MSLRRGVRNALISGSVAGTLSTFALMLCGRAEIDDPVAPLNGPSQWIFGTPAAYRRGWQRPFTPWGVIIHHGMSFLWAGIFEAMRKAKAPHAATAAAAGGTAALACFVDYRCTPERFTPGFHRVLSKTALAVVYVAFAAGLFVGAAGTEGARSADRRSRKSA